MVEQKDEKKVEPEKVEDAKTIEELKLSVKED